MFDEGFKEEGDSEELLSPQETIDFINRLSERHGWKEMKFVGDDKGAED